ncbi:hypothetical protein [Serratia sp. 22264]|uniref:hypothetical protein n=1 Tax=Serratia sp. 22264 TaxID=3453897 RepID=UPI003F87387E
MTDMILPINNASNSICNADWIEGRESKGKENISSFGFYSRDKSEGDTSRKSKSLTLDAFNRSLLSGVGGIRGIYILSGGGLDRRYMVKHSNNSTYSIIANGDIHNLYIGARKKLDNLMQDITSKGHFDDGPTLDAAIDAEHFIENNLRMEGLVSPKIRAISGGEINFYWDTVNILLDVAICGDKTFSYYSKIKGSGNEICADSPINNKLPAVILEELKVK